MVKDAHGLWLVSPYYFSSGGIVIDWFPADKWNEEENEEASEVEDEETMLPF